MLTAARANLDELACREATQSRGADPLSGKVAADQSCIRLADFDEELACLMVRDARDVEALVLIAVTQDWYVQHINKRLRPLLIASARTGGHCERRPTGIVRRVAHARLRRVQGSAA